jgi:hypothetical protein
MSDEYLLGPFRAAMLNSWNPGDNGGSSTFGGGNSNVYADSGGTASSAATE